jgi:hypothetical protein
VDLVTGGAAKVTIEYPPLVFPGETVRVKIVATSTGAKIESAGAFVDLVGTEEPRTTGDTVPATSSTNVAKRTLEKELPVAPAFVLAAGETRTFEGDFVVPRDAQPTYVGINARHGWQIRGRIEAPGNDPDSGYLPIRVGLRE